MTPVSTTPPVRATTLPSKRWRDLAFDLMVPLPSGERLLATLRRSGRASNKDCELKRVVVSPWIICLHRGLVCTTDITVF